ncbi:MAG: EboA domain-containing protein [Methylomonas sp.]|nr:EboA domain-containing protein [Methylomonas sp.]
MQWLLSGQDKIKAKQDVVNDLLTWSAGARSTLGQERLNANAEAISVAENRLMPIDQWSIADAGRALLILQAVMSAPEQHALIVRSYFEQGDESEVAIMVRIVNLFYDAESYKFQVREVGRTNSKPLYAALAQYNPYPARFYDDHEFNQLVLKALFIGVGIASIIGLSERANFELSKMCEDYIDERVAAGRSIPPDIWLALEPFASANGLGLIHQHLQHDTPEHRYFAVKALKQQKPLCAERQQWLNTFRKNEKDHRILALLSSN